MPARRRPAVGCGARLGAAGRSSRPGCRGCWRRVRRWSGSVLASRPWWQVVRQSAADPGARVVAGLQARQGLTVDGGRTYAEQTVAWMSWWVGPAALALALVATAVLAHRAASAWVDGRELPGVEPARPSSRSARPCSRSTDPGITPDHPWADRRLVIALPTVVVLTVACAAVVSRWSTRRLPYAVNVAVSVRGRGGPARARPAWRPGRTRDERVEQGEWAAVDHVCAAHAPGRRRPDGRLAGRERVAAGAARLLRGAAPCRRRRRCATTRAGWPPRSSRSSRAVEARGGRLVLVAADSTEALSRLGLKTAVVGGRRAGRRGRPAARGSARTRWCSCRSRSGSAARLTDLAPSARARCWSPIADQVP